MKWWTVWQEIDGNGIKAYSFESEPKNEDIESCSENGWNMIGYPVMAETEERAIVMAIASDD